jgi:hypothetical protein
VPPLQLVCSLKHLVSRFLVFSAHRGRPGDEAADSTPLDPNDPNYDEEEAQRESREYSYDPSDSSAIKFASSLSDLGKFKAAVKSAAKEYVNSGDAAEFERVLKSLSMNVYHQDLPYILIRYSLDLSDSERARISSLLHALYKSGFISITQMGAGCRKVYNALPDLLVDCPNARTLVREHCGFAVAGGFLDSGLAASLEAEQDALSDAGKVQATKAKIKSIVNEFFVAEDLPDALKSLQELNAPHLAYEAVKIIISQALDRGNRQREGCSVFLADAGTYLKQEDIEKGFTLTLERVEDLSLDVPNILKLLSAMVARAVVDEALPPAFLVRVDLHSHDLGGQVVQQAQELLKRENASDELQYVWEDMEQEEQNKKQKGKQEEKQPAAK